MKKIIGIFIALLIIHSCAQDPYPLTPLSNPGAFTSTWGIKWTLYDDELNTIGGDVLYYPSNPGSAVMLLENKENSSAYSGKKYFSLYWSGDPIYWEADPPDNPTNTYEYSFSGISLIHATRPDYYDTTEPLDLTDANYTRVTFYARGVLSTGVKVKFEGPNGALLDNVNLTTAWQKFEMALTDLNNIRDFFKVTIYYPAAEVGGPQSSGGYVDFDLVSYEK
ncbi:MAG: hypothetical protein KKH98_11050 [Spirochaetes bacterium]|nr:hypothetical protein [Spirochaetota bacterium]